MLHYIKQGSGPCIILIHGFLESHTMWRRLIPKFISKNSVIAVDLPGHGKSSINKDESIDSMADRVKEVLDAENITSYKIIGHSMGGYVGAVLSQKDDRVNKLTLLNSHLDCDSDEKKKVRSKVADFVLKHYPIFVRESVPGLFYEPNIALHKNLVDDAIEEALSFDPKGISICTKAMRDRGSSIEWAAKSDLAIHFITGNQDSIMPLEMIQKQHKQLENSSITVIENCGHMAHIEALDKLLAVISD